MKLTKVKRNYAFGVQIWKNCTVNVMLETMFNCPSWTSSTFPFEGNIYYLKRLVNSPRGMEQQISRKSLQLQSFKLHRSITLMPTIVEKYCDDVLSSTLKTNPKDETSFLDPIKTDVHESGSAKKYSRIIYKGHTYTTIDYTVCKTFNDSTIQTRDERFYKIIEISCKNKSCTLKLTELEAEKLKVGNTVLKNIWLVKNDIGEKVISLEDILCKVNLITVESKRFFL